MRGTDGTAWPTAWILLSDDERETLERWARRPKTGLALRCRIVLAAADGSRNQQIAAKLGCYSVTLGKWRNSSMLARRTLPHVPINCGTWEPLHPELHKIGFVATKVPSLNRRSADRPIPGENRDGARSATHLPRYLTRQV
jgi:hypothetical protein